MARPKSGLSKGTLATCTVCSAGFVRNCYGTKTCSSSCGSKLSRASQPKSGLAKGASTTCVVCSVGFVRSYHGSKTCSQSCGSRMGQASRSADAAVRRTRQCATCGVTFVAKKWSGKALRGESNEGTYCSHACRVAPLKKYASRYEGKLARLRQRTAARREAITPIPCAHCAQAFKPVYACSKFCSRECVEAARLEAKLKPKPQPVLRKRVCVVCSSDFVSAHMVRPVTCSEACRLECQKAQRKASRARRKWRARSGVVELVQPLLVFRRDGWRCHLCGKKTLKAKRGTTHRMAPELDHILPLARGGKHSYDNVACACKGCNSSKGATPRGQMLMFGAFVA